MAQLNRAQRLTPQESDFKRIVALAILFHEAERIHNQMEFQGYRANVVTYSVARLSHELGRYLDFGAIWKEQALPQPILDALKIIIQGVRDVVTKPPATQRNVTEWCKKEDCWTAVLERPIRARLGQVPRGESESFVAPPTTALAPEHQQLIELVRKVLPDVWFAISAWAKKTSSLQPWQRGLAYSLGRLSATARAPSSKQARQGQNLLLEATRLGFRHDSLSDELVLSLRNMTNSSN
jgi:AIPR protein